MASTMKILLSLLLLLSPAYIFASSLHEDFVDLIDASTIHNVQPTGSMEPVLNEKCYLLVARIAFNELKVGDIILFDTNGLLMVHRIISISSSGSYMATKGDANTVSDPGYVTEQNYVGAVIGIIRKDFMQKVLTSIRKEAE